MELQMIKNIHDINEHTKHWIDWTSIGVVLGTLMNFLPAAAALASLVWSLIRIYETKTVQDWLKKRRNKNAK
jgi:hypothetical protein